MLSGLKQWNKQLLPLFLGLVFVESMFTRQGLNYEEEMLAVVAANVVVGFVGWVGGGWQLGFDG